MANINIKIPEDIHKQLKIEAITRDMTLKEYIIQKLGEKQNKK
ncbi:toxin-antitoxin system HicB family antitoxin [Candidatus Woesearchaeota archaeon]|nr:toxin-antitoxin system HicB family antitoxin [Candidatus Woesearchaeota archaeon]